MVGPEPERPLLLPGSSARWRVVGDSVQGALHQRGNVINQDALAWRPEVGKGLSLAVAVADGHGSAKCFRSDRGARFAVELAVQVLWDFMAGHKGLNPSTVKRTAEDHLPRTLAWRWKQRVDEDLRQVPVTSEELEALEAKEGPSGRRSVVERPTMAYGSTVVAVAASDSYLLFLQLGDGDILRVTTQGEVDMPLPTDDRIIADETTSLCSPHAEDEFRVGFHSLLGGEQPALVLLSTDGYSKSYSEPAGFRQVGPDILRLIQAEGLDSVGAQVKGWLTQVSERGSGDDITLAVLWNEATKEITSQDEIIPQREKVHEDELIKDVENVSSDSIVCQNLFAQSEGENEGHVS
jgi:serine/threonine protein phosphatase PrpC